MHDGHRTGTRMIEKTGRVMLTARGIASLPPGSWAANPTARGVGVLQVRKLEDGKSAFYYRYTRTDQKRYRLPKGHLEEPSFRSLPVVE